MIAYRDMTFCPYHADCTKASACGRALTDEVKEFARKWWGEDGAPIAQYAERPSCHDTARITGGDPI